MNFTNDVRIVVAAMTAMISSIMFILVVCMSLELGIIPAMFRSLLAGNWMDIGLLFWLLAVSLRPLRKYFFKSLKFSLHFVTDPAVVKPSPSFS